MLPEVVVPGWVLLSMLLLVVVTGCTILVCLCRKLCSPGRSNPAPTVSATTPSGTLPPVPPTPPPQPLSVNLTGEQFAELLRKLTVVERQSEDCDMDDADMDDDNGSGVSRSRSRPRQDR